MGDKIYEKKKGKKHIYIIFITLVFILIFCLNEPKIQFL
jgi:hypothetical protein